MVDGWVSACVGRGNAVIINIIVDGWAFACASKDVIVIIDVIVDGWVGIAAAGGYNIDVGIGINLFKGGYTKSIGPI